MVFYDYGSRVIGKGTSLWKQIFISCNSNIFKCAAGNILGSSSRNY